MNINLINIVHQTAADGPGLRQSIYCAGCFHHCKGCHNPQTWDPKYGESVPVETILKEILEDTWSDVTFTGGDPMYQVEAFTELARLIKENSNKTIWLFTGFTYEEIKADERMSMILPYIDVIVDGPFILEERDETLPFRGSRNQRIINLKEML